MKKKIFIAILAVIIVVFIAGCFIFKDEIGKVKHIIYPINKKYEEKNTDNDIEKATKKKLLHKLCRSQKNQKKKQKITKNK